MAIKGAFGAGFVQGFGESMKKNAEKRFDQQQRYVDNMMENARRLAPKFTQDKATADNAVDLMNEFQTRYGVSNEEFIALYQTHDINEVYKTIQSAEAGLRPNEQLNVRSQILGALDIPKGTKLPDGMTAEDAVRSMVLGYAQNLGSKPGDTSEPHKNNSWAKAVSNVLALNPRASAEEQIAGMKVAGVPVQQILQYQAMQGDKYKPLQGVTRSGIINFDDGYSDGDYDTTYSSYASAFRLTFAGTDDIAALDGLPLKEAMERSGANTKEELVERVKAGGVAIAELELALANVGVGKTTRDSSMRRIAAEVNTAQEFDNMKAAVNSGLAVDLIRESMDKHGAVTDEYIAKILQNQPMKQEPIERKDKVLTADDKEEKSISQQMIEAGFTGGDIDPSELPFTSVSTEAAEPVDPSLTNAGIVSGLVTPEVESTTAMEEPKADAVPEVSAPIEEKVSAPTVQNINDAFDEGAAEEKALTVEDQAENRYQAVQSFLDEASATAGEATETAAQVVSNVVDITDRAALNASWKAGTAVGTAVGATAQALGYDDTAKSLYKWSIENKDRGRTTPLLTQHINDLLDNLTIPYILPDGVPDYSRGINLPSPDSEMGGAGPILGAIPLADMTVDFVRSLNQEESAEVLVKEIFDDVAAMSDAEKAAKIEELKAVAATLKEGDGAGVNVLTRATDTPASKELQAMIDDSRSDVAGFNVPGESTTYEIDPNAALEAGKSILRDGPEMISYEEWKDMSKADRKKIGLDLSTVAIQNRTRGGRITIPEGYRLPARLRMSQPDNRATPEAEARPRVPADEAIMTRPTKQDLTSPTTESSISVERSTGPSKSLADLRTTFNRIHGKKSKASKQLEKILQEAQSGTPIQYTDVNRLLRTTRSLPKTKTRDELAAKLYDLAQGLR